jgi:hypothetical protein
MMLMSNTSLNISNRHHINFKANCVVVTAKYTTFAKYGRPKLFLSPCICDVIKCFQYSIDIAKSKSNSLSLLTK